MSEVWPGISDEDGWENEEIRFSPVRIQRQVDSQIAHRKATAGSEAFRVAVRENDPGIVGIETFPEQTDGGDV